MMILIKFIMNSMIKDIILKHGWVEVESKNKYMFSFVLPNDSNTRINYYFTSGTVTLQSPNNPIVVMKEVTPEEMEQALS